MGVDRVRMRATVGQVYDGHRLYIGDTFDAHPDEVSELLALRLAVRVINGEGATAPAPSHAEPQPASRRRYKRRDLLPQ